MKKKAILASSLALALMASPFGCRTVSAEEGENISAHGEIHETAEQVGLNAPQGPRQWSLSQPVFTVPAVHCGYSYTSDVDGFVWPHIWLYKDDELVKEYVWTDLGYHFKKGETKDFFPLISQDMNDPGVYTFEMRMETNGPDGLIVSEKVQMDRPATCSADRPVLGTTTCHWDTETTGVLHYTSMENASGYEYRLYRLENGQWNPCTFISAPSGTLLSVDHAAAYNNMGGATPRDAGGEDRTIDLTANLSEGNSYCVTVRALSGNPTTNTDYPNNCFANGVESEKSDALQFNGRSNAEDSDRSDDSDDSDDAGAPSLLEEKIAAAKPGDVIRLQDVLALTSSEVRQLLDHKMSVEMEYTYEGRNYKVRIPAGASIDESIPVYGPLYLAQYYGVKSLSTTAAANGPTYTVQKGDTLGRIARANNMSLKELAAKNPQIKNLDIIMPGQAIQIK